MVELTAMHTLWYREHNRIATELHQLNPYWRDEIVFQEARRILVGELQQITYNEFLPVLLGTIVITGFINTFIICISDLFPSFQLASIVTFCISSICVYVNFPPEYFLNDLKALRPFNFGHNQRIIRKTFKIISVYRR